MAIIKTRGGKTNVGEMICYWDEAPALLFIRNEIEKSFRHFLKVFEGVDAAEMPTESEIGMTADLWMRKAESLFEKHAAEIFYQAQIQLVTDVWMKITQQFVQDIFLTIVPDHKVELSRFKDVQKEISRLLKKAHNEAIGIRPGREAQVSVEKIIERLSKLPKSVGLARLAAEMNLSQRTIQYTLKAAGLTFKAAKRKAKE